jgi:DNA-binding MarR family transcriptional regulator
VETPRTPPQDAPVRWLDAREQRAWRALLAVQTELFAHLRRTLARDTGLSDADYAVLVHLSEAPEERLRIFELVAALQWEKSRLSHQLRRMEQRGLVERTGCETDGRGAFASLTDEGRGAIAAAAPLHVAEVRRHFADPLRADQLDALVEIGSAVLSSLESAAADDDCSEDGEDRSRGAS